MATTTFLRVPLAFERIKDRLRRRIERDWQPGDRLPPIDELARTMGVGEKNAYRAVQALVQEGIVVSRPRLGTYVAHRLRHATTHSRPDSIFAGKTIHMPLTSDRDGMINRMADAFVEELRRRGGDVASVQPLGWRQFDLSTIDADAFVIINSDLIHRLTLRDDQLLSIIDTTGRHPLSMTDRFDVVSPDQEQGGELIGNLLRDYDERDVLYVGTGQRTKYAYDSWSEARLAGFERGLGRRLAQDHKLMLKYSSREMGPLAVISYMQMKHRPRAVFCCCDDISLGFMYGASAHGLVAGKDYEMYGFDGQSAALKLQTGRLTTVAVPAEQMGRQAAELLESRFAQPRMSPRRLAFGCTIVQSGETGMECDEQ